MATLNRNTMTDQYFIEMLDAGEPVVSHVPPEGVKYLQEIGIEEGSDIPDEMLTALRSNGFLSTPDEDSDAFSGDAPVEELPPVANETETNAQNTNARAVSSDPLPSPKMQPRPWMEQDNVEAFKEGTEAADADIGKPEKQPRWTQADRSSANPLTHGEDAAFIGNVWMWVLIVAVVVIVVWGLFEIF